MRRILGYVDGRAIWSENVPANPGSMPIRGSLVVGESAHTKRLEVAAKHRDKVRAEKADAA